MKSIRQFYKIGKGPSSSHTMGPEKAMKSIKQAYQEADRFKVILYGSLAHTGKGHLTDKAIKNAVAPTEVDIVFDKLTECKVHSNTMDIIAYKNEDVLDKWRVYSVGGGNIEIEGKLAIKEPEIYEYTTFNDIKRYCKQEQIKLYEYVYKFEGKEFKKYLQEVWNTMQNTVESGLRDEGIIPGKLKLTKRAKNILEQKIENESETVKQSRLLTAYAYAVSETNASGGTIVTAPTCGASGVLPSVLYYAKHQLGFSDENIIDALAVAGLIGNIIKENASISGAECGCQAEIGTACSMAAAAYSQLHDFNIEQIECAAEVAMEHHLGLTCDPIYGYVQIPCIERNAVAAIRAIDSANIALFVSNSRKISFDMVVDTMYETGKDLQTHYRETSEGGLAKKYCRNKFYNKELE